MARLCPFEIDLLFKVTRVAQCVFTTVYGTDQARRSPLDLLRRMRPFHAARIVLHQQES